MYDKQLDSGKGTLLHLCDDVIQQEVDLLSTLSVFLSIDKINKHWFRHWNSEPG